MRQAHNGFFMTALVGLWLMMGLMPTFAQGSGGWQVREISPNQDGTKSVLWVKPGAGLNGAYSGDTASVWRLDSSGKETAIGPSYGPFPGWYAVNVAPVSNGTTRLGWAKQEDSSNPGNDTTVSVWTLDANGKETAMGPAYGPFPGWSNQGSEIAPDGTTRLYWNKPGTYAGHGVNSGDAVSLWTLDATGKKIAQGPVYGPYLGWIGDSFQIASDGTVRFLWENPGTGNDNGDYSGDQVSVWTLDAAGKETAQGPVYGPFPGWSGNNFAIAPDNTVRLLWINHGITDNAGAYSGDQASLWALDAKGVKTAQGPVYGRFPGWTAYFVFEIAYDNTVRLLWTNAGTTDGSGAYSGDQVSLWTLNAVGSAAAQGPVYGRFPGWRCNDFLIARDNTARLNWINPGTVDSSNIYSGDQVSIWTLDAAGKETVQGPAYGRFSGWHADSAILTSNSVTDILWAHDTPGTFSDGNTPNIDQFSVWLLNAADTETSTGTVYGPFH